MTTGKHRWSAAAECKDEYWTSILESPGYEEDADPPYDEVLAKLAPSWSIITARPCARISLPVQSGGGSGGGRPSVTDSNGDILPPEAP